MGLFGFGKKKNQSNNLVPGNKADLSNEQKKNEMSVQDDTFGNLPLSAWYATISFGKSTSANFDKALFLAKASDRYIEDVGESGKTIYQATYKAKNYLNFIQLYELVGSWKSAFVIINGQIMDRKIVGGLNYCYGDKLRSGKDDFCFGASEFTENPFGCHRLQISASNNPWWSFGQYNTKKQWVIDKKAIENRIQQMAVPYRECPCFNINASLSVLKKLPKFIDPKKDKKEWVFHPNGIEPRSIYDKRHISITIDLNIRP